MSIYVNQKKLKENQAQLPYMNIIEYSSTFSTIGNIHSVSENKITSTLKENKKK